MGYESINMFINFVESWPNATVSELKSDGIIGDGLIKTVSKNNKIFCNDQGCKYHVTLNVVGMKWIIFFPSILPNRSEIHFKESVSVLEELEENEIIEYVYIVPVNESNWVFTLTPYEDVVEFFVNENSRPTRLTEYNYKVSSLKTEELIIKSLKTNTKQNDRVFYVLYKSQNPSKKSTFQFKIKRHEPHENFKVKENVFEQGVLEVENEITNYEYDLQSNKNEKHEFIFSLELFDGAADMFIKDCTYLSSECKISKNDIELSENKQDEILEQSKQTNSLRSKIRKSKYSNSERTQYISIKVVSLVGPGGRNFAPQDYYLDRRYAIGVRNLNKNPKIMTKYKLEIHGENETKKLDVQTSTFIKIDAKTVQRFYILNTSKCTGSSSKLLALEIFLINGDFELYMSQLNEHPNEVDNSSQMIVKNPNRASIKTTEHKKLIYLLENAGDKIYLTIKTKYYSVFDILPIIKCDLDDNHVYEKISDEKVIHRKITKTEHDICQKFQTKTDFNCFAKRFIFEPEQAVDKYVISNEINIHLNSDYLGLRICVTEFSENENEINKCLAESQSHFLTFKKEEFKNQVTKSFFIWIYALVENELTSNLDFSLKVSGNNSEKAIELTKSGHLMISKLTDKSFQLFSLDLKHIDQNFSFFMTSPDPSVIAIVELVSKRNTEEVIILNSSRFGFKTIDIDEFKNNKCKTSCSLIIKVFRKSNLTERFSLLYVRESDPIVMFEGEQITIPNNMRHYLYYESHTIRKYPISFSAHNEHQKSIVYAKSVKPGLEDKTMKPSEMISEKLFDYKTNSEVEPRIVIRNEPIENKKTLSMLFLITPSDQAMVSVYDSYITEFNIKDQSTVHIHENLLKLPKFLQTKSEVKINDMVYFYFDLDSLDNFSITLTLLSGEAKLYINDGSESLPTQKKYWKKTKSPKGDEIVVTKHQLVSESRKIGRYFIGVHGMTDARFSILYLPNFENLMKISFQKLTEVELEANKMYYFSYFNDFINYDTLLYTQNGDAEISAFSYGTSSDDFFTSILDQKSYTQSFVLKMNDLPRRKSFESSLGLFSTNIIRVKALHNNIRFVMAIYDPSKPIQLNTQKQFEFVVDENETNIFHSQLGGEFNEIEVFVKCEVGEIILNFSENQNDYSNKINLFGNSNKKIVYKIKNKEKSNDIIFFNDFFIKIEAKKLSKFSILVLPKDKFQEIKEGISEIIKTSTERDVYLYHYLSAARSASLTAFSISILRHELYQNKPDLLFISDYDVVLSENSPFLPMPIIDIYEKNTLDYLHVEIQPEFLQGFYVLKFAKTDTPKSIKISIAYNDAKNLELNSFQRGLFPYKMNFGYEYSMYVHQPGEIRLVVETCDDLVIKEGRFYGHIDTNKTLFQNDNNQYFYDNLTEITQINFDENMKQNFFYLRLNLNGGVSSIFLQEVRVKIARVFFTSPGVFRFKITKTNENQKVSMIEEANNNYRLMSEFRPSSKELILLEYIQLFNSNEDLHNLKLAHKLSKSTGELTVSVRVPTFKPQFLIDYPEITKAIMKFHFYVFSDTSFHRKFELCGLSCFDSIPHSKMTSSFDFDKNKISISENAFWIFAIFDKNALEIVE